LIWVLLLALALGLRLLGIRSTSLWHDEITSIHAARLGLYDVTVRMSLADNQLPLYFLVLKAWALVSWSELWLRLLSVAWSLVAVVAAVRWIRHWDSRAGWMAGLLTATCPLLVHYGQEVRTYALLYAVLLLGLGAAERSARTGRRSYRIGVIVTAVVLSYSHFVGLIAAGMLWVYMALRTAALVGSAVRTDRVGRVSPALPSVDSPPHQTDRRTWRTLLAGVWVWIILSLPAVAVGAFHSSLKIRHGYWIPSLGWEQAWALLTGCTGHEWIDLWEEAGPATVRPWVALAGRALLTAGIGGALLASLFHRRSDLRSAIGAMLAAAAAGTAVTLAVCWLVVPIALERTVFPLFLPLIGVLSLACAKGKADSPLTQPSGVKGSEVGRYDKPEIGPPGASPAILAPMPRIGTWACGLAVLLWAATSAGQIYGGVERRPNEQRLFGAVARAFQPGDVVIGFPADMQASLAYFLDGRASPEQVCCTDKSRLTSAGQHLRVLPVPLEHNPNWFDDFLTDVVRARFAHPKQHAIWLVSLGARTMSDPDLRRVQEWLDLFYRPAEGISCGDRWTLSAQRYVPKPSDPLGTP